VKMSMSKTIPQVAIFYRWAAAGRDDDLRERMQAQLDRIGPGTSRFFRLVLLKGVEALEAEAAAATPQPPDQETQ